MQEGNSVLVRKSRMTLHKVDTNRQNHHHQRTASSAKPTPASKSFFKSGRCYRCGDPAHKADECKYKDSECRKCGVKGHLQKVCQSATKSVGSSQRKRVYTVRCKNLKGVHCVRTRRPDITPIKIVVDIEGAEATMEVDSGCGVTIMPRSRFEKVNPSFRQHPADILLQVANGQEVTPHAFVEVKATMARITRLKPEGRSTIYFVFLLYV